MPSIRGKLIVWIWILLSLILFAITFWNVHNTRQQLLSFFDAQLIETNLTLSALHQQLLQTSNLPIHPLLESLVTQHPALNKNYPDHLPASFLTYQLPKILQIWDKQKQELLYKSKLAPSQVLLENKAEWYVFALPFPDTNLIYIVAEPAEIRNIIIQHFSLAQIWPMFCLWIILLLLSWLVIRLCINPLEKISQALALRQPDYLEHIDDKNIPKEIKPIVKQINYLFARLSAAFAREKRFTADAAHELRTPLAALKIQAQVALEAEDEQMKKSALHKITQGVDRCTHLIEQLTLLTYIKPDEPLKNVEIVNLTDIAQEIIVELFTYANRKSVEIELFPEGKISIKGNRIMLSILLRNVIDNAIRYTYPSTKIVVSLYKQEERVILRVQDQGPGIPAELHERVFEQFYRGENQILGSGLGLAIVQQIVALYHA